MHPEETMNRGERRKAALKAVATRMRRKGKMRSHRGALVKGYAEGLSASLLEKFPEAFKAVVGRKSGIYILTKNKEVYYVGMAGKLPDRLKKHLEDRHRRKWDGFNFYRIGKKKYIKDIESILIRVVDPEGNKIRGRFGSKRNLRNKLRGEIQDWINQQLEQI